MSALRLCFVLALGHCLLVAVVGCSTVQRFMPRDESNARAAQLQELQLKVMRFADDYTGRIRDPIESLNVTATPPEIRLWAHNWRVSQATAAYTIASGSNPTINALDMIVLATLSRMVVEDRLLDEYGPRAQALLETQRHLEQQSWSLVDGVLDAEQSNDLRASIEKWRAEHPQARAVTQVRFADFAALELRRGDNEQHVSGGLFGLIGLDPLSNLDPAVRELEQTRQLAERTIYYLQRAPTLLDMEVERLVYQLAAMPEAQRTLTGVDRLSFAAEAVGQLSNRAPEIIASERHAIIAELTAALHAEQDRLQPLLVDIRDVLNAGTQTSQSVTGTVTALDAFIARFQPGEPAATAAPSASKRPFDITEYAATARELAAAADRVQALLLQLDSSSKDVERIAHAATQDVNSVIDHAFRRAIVLILVLGAVAVSGALLYRYWSPRLPPVRMARVPPLT
jgi:hypothetical protein